MMYYVDLRARLSPILIKTENETVGFHQNFDQFRCMKVILLPSLSRWRSLDVSRNRIAVTKSVLIISFYFLGGPLYLYVHLQFLIFLGIDKFESQRLHGSDYYTLFRLENT